MGKIPFLLENFVSYIIGITIAFIIISILSYLITWLYFYFTHKKIPSMKSIVKKLLPSFGIVVGIVFLSDLLRYTFFPQKIGSIFLGIFGASILIGTIIYGLYTKKKK